MDGWEVATAISAAQRGGEVLRRHFRELRPGDIEAKGENDWVSIADRASEAAILELLGERTPGFAVLAEESGAFGACDGPRWVIDPLDGTANFVRGFPHFAVSIALVADGRVELGVVVDPMRDEAFVAVHGGGSTCNGRPLRVSGRPQLAGAFVTTGFPFRIHRHIDTYLAIFRDVFLAVGAIRRPGAAALDLAHTACGIFDGFFEFSLAAWDIAAGALLIREAGGVVTDLDGGDAWLERGNVVAGTPAVQDALLGLCRRHCRESGLAE
ncbi:MAG: inositol monophosphatase [Acidobacteria bacterium]|nr:inositol monophosphatase [Acidobacteriota bacterium]